MTMTDEETRAFALDGVKSEPLTYERESRVSFFADLVRQTVDPRAAERLQRHAQEMRVITEEREHKAWRAIRSGDFEYRVTPSTTDGYGGYFAPPLWVNQLFATANRPRRILAALAPEPFPLPQGVSSVNLPIISTGTSVQPVQDNTSVPDTDFTDLAGSSNVVTLTGDADVSLQLLEQSPAGAHLDFAIFQDLTEASDAQLETQLINGGGSSLDQILGVMNVSGINSVSYTGATTGSAMYPYFGQAAGEIGDNRYLPPECWLMRTARWTWLMSSEDTATLPFGLYSPFFLGNDEDSPDPTGGLLGWPVFPDDAIPTNVTGANRDVVIILRPSDLILLEGQPQTAVMREPLSGSLGVRLQLHTRVAAITNRHAAGISVISGSGMAIQSGF